MDSPPHILKPLRTILLETASEKKVETQSLGFYQESAECRFRPLANNFKELKMFDFLAALIGIFYRPSQ